MSGETRTITVLSVILLVAFIGCSSKQSVATHPIEPEMSMPSLDIDGFNGNHNILGSWVANFDVGNASVSVEPNRELMAHFNIRPLIPAPVIVIKSFDWVNQIVEVDVTISNPFMINGYDVRLIIYTDNPGHLLKNPDDWTALFDIPGGMEINPFKAYAKSEPLRMFAGNTQHTENLRIHLPGWNSAVNFAIDASYPGNCLEPYRIYDYQQDLLYDELNHTAEMKVYVSCWESSADLIVEFECAPVMGSTVLELDEGFDEEFFCTIINSEWAPVGEYDGIIKALSDESSIYLYDIVTVEVIERLSSGWALKLLENNAIGVETGGLDENIYSCVRDSVYYEMKMRKHDIYGVSKWTRDLLTEDSFYDISDCYTQTVGEISYVVGSSNACMPPHELGMMLGRYYSDSQKDWSLYWCSSTNTNGTTVAGDRFGNSYMTYIYQISGYNTTSAALRKYDSDGVIAWSNAYNNMNGSINFTDTAFNDTTSSFHAVGQFWGTYVDFDFSSGTYNIAPSGERDAFLARYNTSGQYTMLKTWGDSAGGSAEVKPEAVAIDSGNNIYIVGEFNGQVDFDPSTGETEKQSLGGMDIFVSKINATGNFIKVIQLGSIGTIESGLGIAIDPDDNIYVTGGFETSVDFDPGPNQAGKTSVGGTDIFLAKYTDDLHYIWVRTWGSIQNDRGVDVACSWKNGYVFLMGEFWGTIDFDPSREVYELTAEGITNNIVLMKLLPNGYW